ncbi:MAG: insulinase family protein [Treponema sp.]|nr:insulinase family protein [Treponema sp.]
MFDFTDASNIGKEYKSFVLLSIDDLPDYKTKAVYLRHKTTGLEVYHILAEDKENLFAFGFRTLSKDSLGTAHIMEHSTLCGSERFPLKEPFTTLAGQSLNTFLNAMTYPDKTVYPASSLVPSDYFNMMDVYADAVFFPKLDYTTFMQEGHRLELDDEGKISIQGVVYNEMKGNYSSFFQIAFSQLIGAMYPDSYPAFDSGGDPLEIPNLTYQQFLDFHQKFYNPDNCLLFLYGDIPTSQQLDFLCEKYIDRLEKKYNCTKTIAGYDSKLPIVKDSVKKLQELKFQTSCVELKNYACDAGATGSLVASNWYTGEYNCEKSFLSEVLCGNDSSPVSKKLKDSGLGDDLVCGNFGQFPVEIFSFGLSGVKKGNEKKVFTLVENIISDLYKEGISQQDIDSAIMGIDFNLREQKRYGGPYSIRLMEFVLKAWSVGKACCSRLSPISDFEKLKEKIRSNKDFTKQLIEKYFMKDAVKVNFISEPSATYFKEREKGEAALTEQLKKNVDLTELKLQLEKLHAEQQRKETAEELSVIPHTKISQLNPRIEYAEPVLEYLKGADGSDIPLFINDVKTNGIFYIDVCFPFDCLEPEDIQHINFLSEVITNLGWNNKKWDECIAESACIMGDTYGGMLSGATSNAPDCVEFAKIYKDKNFMGRYWLCISCKALTSYAKPTLELFSQIITTMDFKDEKRLSMLLKELIADTKASVIPEGRSLSARWARSLITVNTTMKEILYGLSQVKTVMEYKKTKPAKLLKKFESIYKQCVASGGVIHLYADTDSLTQIKPMLPSFVEKTGIKKLQPARELTVELLKPYVYNYKACEEKNSQTDIKVDSQTGYGVLISKNAQYLSKELAAELVLTNWLNTHALWEKLRTTGGAYGASVSVDGLNEVCVMGTYRDPSPEKSVQVYLETLEELQNAEFTEDEIERTIVTIYGDRICPDSPKATAMDSFERMIYGCSIESQHKKMEQLLSVKPEDVKAAAKRLYENTKVLCKKVVFCDKKNKTSGKTLKLPL